MEATNIEPTHRKPAPANQQNRCTQNLNEKKPQQTKINPKARHNFETEEEESRIWRRKTEVFILLEPIETK